MDRSFLKLKNPGIIKKIKEWEPEGILIYGWNYWSHIKCILYFTGKIKVYFRGDSTTLKNETYLYSIIKKISLNFLFSYVDKAFYVGKENKKYFMKYGLTKSKLAFVPHCVDNSFFKANKWGSEQLRELRLNLGLTETNVTFLYAGKFISIKNLSFLIQCFKQLQDSNIRLLLVGSGIEEDNLKRESEQDKRILFLPFQNQKAMSYLYRLGDIFVLPSYNETWGLSINEAMASGLAILASNKTGAAHDLIQEGVNGFSFDLYSHSDLVSKMSLVSKKSVLKDFKKSSLGIINEWSFQNACKRLIINLQD